MKIVFLLLPSINQYKTSFLSNALCFHKYSVNNVVELSFSLWHRRLGHTSPIVTKHILGINNKDVDSNSLCEIYSLVK